VEADQPFFMNIYTAKPDHDRKATRCIYLTRKTP